jgi:hypothetical protein
MGFNDVCDWAPPQVRRSGGLRLHALVQKWSFPSKMGRDCSGVPTGENHSKGHEKSSKNEATSLGGRRITVSTTSMLTPLPAFLPANQ